MKKLQFCVAMSAILWLTSAAHAEEKLDCASLKQSIEAKMNAHGVKKFKLDVVDNAQAGAGKIVGSCDGGAHKIIYSKEAAAAQK
jgi:hypothetical protein